MTNWIGNKSMLDKTIEDYQERRKPTKHHPYNSHGYRIIPNR